MHGWALVPRVAWLCMRNLSSNLGSHFKSLGFLFFFVSATKLFSVLKVVQWCMRNSNSSSCPIPNLPLSLAFFPFFCCRHYWATFNTESNLVVLAIQVLSSCPIPDSSLSSCFFLVVGGAELFLGTKSSLVSYEEFQLELEPHFNLDLSLNLGFFHFIFCY
jgi:hypothetical protein